jgi:hypothetical protein
LSEPLLLILGGSPERRRRGRRPTYGEPATVGLRHRVTRRQKSDLLEIARAEGRPMSEVVRDALDEYVADFRDRRVFQKPPYVPE